MDKTFGIYVRTIRNRVGLSQTAFGGKMDVSRDRIAKIEIGVMNPTFDFLVCMRRTFRVSIDRLIDKLGETHARHHDSDPV